MFKKGLMFGAGFTVAAIIVGYVFVFLFGGVIFQTGQPPTGPSSYTTYGSNSLEGKTLEKKIDISTAIFITKFNETENGFVTAVVTEVLKSSPGVNLKYTAGDIYPNASYYKEDSVRHGDGVIIFYSGTPGRQQQTYNYSNGRIGGLNNMPLDLFKNMVSGPNA